MEAPRDRQRRLHPHDRAAPPARPSSELLQRCYDAGDIELDVYRGKYCVRCEEYYSDDELLPGDLCPIHKLPVEEFEEENYFFRLSRFQDRLLDWYAAHPGAIVPGVPRQRGARPDPLRAARLLGQPHEHRRGASRCRGTATHVAYVWFDALTNYLVGGRLRRPTPSASTEWWPVDYHLIGKDIIRHHCVYWPAMLMSAGVELPKGWAVGGWLLSGGEKMSKTTGNVVKPLDLVDTVGVDGFRYYVLADTPYGQDGDFTYEGLVGRYNADLANNLGNLLARVATVVDVKCGGTGPAPRAGQPARRRRPPTPSPAPPRRGTSSQPSRALEATWQLIRATNAHLEANEPWKAEPGPAVDAVLGDALEALRIVAILASPGDARRRRRRSGSASACPATSPTSALPGGRRVGRLPRRARRHQGRRRCSRASRHDATADDGWFDSHCHLHDDGSRAGRRRRRRGRARPA